MTAEEAVIELMWRKHFNMAFPTKLIQHKLMARMRFPEEGAFDDIALMYRLLATAKRVAYHGLAKYTFYRHETNNSAWTTNHALLTYDTLQEYLEAYRERTEWLSARFPDKEMAFRYFEWSFMISMVEKISRLKITECADQRDTLIHVLRDNRDAFLDSVYISGFEREWMNAYV